MYVFLYVAFKENFDLQIKKEKRKKNYIIARSSTEAEYTKWYIIQLIAWSQMEVDHTSYYNWHGVLWKD